MRKKLLALLAICLTLCLTLPVFGAQAGWELWGDTWYYCGGFDANGNPFYLKDTVTPDGFYVNGDGIWYVRSTVLMDKTYTAPEKFVHVYTDWTENTATKKLSSSISNAFQGWRQMRATESAIEYKKMAEEKGEADTVLIGLYKEKTEGIYRLDLKVELDSETRRTDEADYYNYQVFRGLLYEISSTPELLESAIFRAWEGDNGWNINRTDWVRVGDSMVKYKAANGYGRFMIAPAVAGQ